MPVPRKPSKPAPKTPAATTPKIARWEITKLGATPAKHLGHVSAPDAETAIAKAIEELKIPQNLHRKLAARKVNY